MQHTPDVEELLLEYAEPSGQRCTVSVCNHLLKCLAAAFGYPYSKDKFNKSPCRTAFTSIFNNLASILPRVRSEESSHVGNEMAIHLWRT